MTAALSSPVSILVVDDDERLRELIARYLSEHAFSVRGAGSAKEAREALQQSAFDLMVLDVMMPGETGLELAADLRRTLSIPILMLTAMSEPENRIAGLESGVDDYLTKPFEPKELVLRIQAILRRTGKNAPTGTTVAFGEFTFDLISSKLRKGEELVQLTSSEAGLLKILAENIGTPLSREDISEKSGYRGNDRTVDVQITRLRRKIEPDARYPVHIQTIRHAGYVLRQS